MVRNGAGQSSVNGSTRLSGSTLTHIGGGFYKYAWDGYIVGTEYSFLSNGGTQLSYVDRIKVGFNEVQTVGDQVNRIAGSVKLNSQGTQPYNVKLTGQGTQPYNVKLSSQGTQPYNPKLDSQGTFPYNVKLDSQGTFAYGQINKIGTIYRRLPGSIANQVWDALQASHGVVNSFGESITNIESDVDGLTRSGVAPGGVVMPTPIFTKEDKEKLFKFIEAIFERIKQVEKTQVTHSKMTVVSDEISTIHSVNPFTENSKIFLRRYDILI